jgi:serine/threonine-protein kinase HipA
MPYAEPVNIGELAHLAQKIFVDREEAHIAPDEEITKQLLMAVGTSAGGRQPKAIIAVNRKTGEIRSGQIAGLDGFDYFILKFGDKERSSAELEMTYYEMARAAGIDMMPCFIKEADGEKHFMTQRFDRPNGQKQHTQTLAAMDPDADSYGALMLTCRKLHLPDAAMDEIFRRMVFNYLANNTDDHHKNFAFMMNNKGEWAITPAYDMTFIFNVRGYQPELNHCLSLRGKRSDWTMEDVLSFANENGIRNPEKIIRQVAAAVMNFRALAEKNEVKPEWIGRIEDVLLTHLREWGFTSGEPSAESREWRAVSGQMVTNVYLEQAYKGNIHLYATIDGVARRWVLRPSMPEYGHIAEIGIPNVPFDILKHLVEERITL